MGLGRQSRAGRLRVGQAWLQGQLSLSLVLGDLNVPCRSHRLSRELEPPFPKLPVWLFLERQPQSYLSVLQR